TFEQAGVLRLEGAEELFDTARAVATQPLPRGPRLAILTNSGGPAILAVDALAASGLTLATLAPATRSAIAALLPHEAATANPIDMLAGATPEQMRFVHAHLAADPGVDAMLAIYTPVTADDTPIVQAIADAVQAAAHAAPGKPTVMNLFGRAYNDAGAIALRDAHIPAYRFPENAVRALGGMRRLAAFRERDATPEARPVVDAAAVAALLRAAPDGW